MSDTQKNLARLLYVKRRRSIWPMWAKFRLANAMFVWIGPLEFGWRMPWVKPYHRACLTSLDTTGKAP